MGEVLDICCLLPVDVGADVVMVLPSTRYLGSKRRIVRWIWDCIGCLKFNSFLDAFGGTGVVGYYAKLNGKQVFYNDILKFNHQIGLAIIENDSARLSDEEVEFILRRHREVEYLNFIQENFRDIYYTDEENRWLDMVAANINTLDNRYKRAIAFSALIQACLVKRPFNLFHRANLYMRLKSVKRSFGNHYIWNKPFSQLFKRFVREYNGLVFSNGKVNRAFNMDIFELHVEADLVYLDPPYVPRHGSPVDYRLYYHFLEGLVDYERWPTMIDLNSPIKAIRQTPSVWTDKDKVEEAFERLIRKFQGARYLVVSYRADGIPSPRKMIETIRKYRNSLQVYSIRVKYILSKKPSRELLFIAS